MQTRRLPADAAGLADAAEALRAGRLVAFPTETVYGLGGDARSAAAVAAIYAAKGRPSANPLIVHVPDAAAARRLAAFDARAEALARAFWPGPLTLVLPLRPEAGLAPAATAGLRSVALRVPQGAVALALLAAAGMPLAAPSANPSGGLSPTSADHVLAGLGGRIAAVLDGGPCRVGLESTILDLSDPGDVRLLRPGGLTSDAVAAVLGAQPSVPGGPAPEAPRAPGQMASHYAPRALLRLEATEARPGEVLLGFGPIGAGGETLSARGDLQEAAAGLFAALHRLDAAGARIIAVAPIPRTGLGLAINDRLARAAAPRGGRPS